MLREIMTVGIRDWCWWVFRLRRNEFHPALNLYRYDGKKGIEDLRQRRERAHRIDMALGPKITIAMYQQWLDVAMVKGWSIPPPYTSFPPSTWVKYWENCYAYEIDHSFGRPVPPHRSGGGSK